MVGLNPANITLTQEWSIGAQLGEGGFGKVFLARSTHEPSAVAKLVPKAPGAGRELLFESLEGIPNVVPVLDKGEWNDYWVLVMPRADKSLRDYMEEAGGYRSPSETIEVLTHITTALSAIEGRIVHRDIKPDNVLLLDGQWCLADFGISRYAEATTSPSTHKYAMTPAYAAPEQWRGERATSATDVYSLGVLGYELLAGRPPFEGPDYRGQHLAASPERVTGIPTKLQSLLTECLYKSTEARPRPRNLLERLPGVGSVASVARQRLQQANDLAVQRKAEAARQRSLAQSEAERRASLGRDASESLEALVMLLQDAIEEHAPASAPAPGLSRWAWALSDALLMVKEFRTPARAVDLPFDVIAYSSIELQMLRQGRDYDGRAHSLWYCDAQEERVFRWYETALMFNPFIGGQVSPIDPFAAEPGREAEAALSPAMDIYQVAWPFTPIDQGGEDEFVERWIDWFADAALGNLRRPTTMPERDPRGSWRR